jgi:hypothetical protein
MKGTVQCRGIKFKHFEEQDGIILIQTKRKYRYRKIICMVSGFLNFLFSYPALDPDPSVKKQKCFDKFWIYAVVRLQNNFLS